MRHLDSDTPRAQALGVSFMGIAPWHFLLSSHPATEPGCRFRASLFDVLREPANDALPPAQAANDLNPAELSYLRQSVRWGWRWPAAPRPNWLISQWWALVQAEAADKHEVGSLTLPRPMLDSYLPRRDLASRRGFLLLRLQGRGTDTASAR